MIHVIQELQDYDAYKKWKEEEDKKKKPKKTDWRWPLLLLLFTSWGFIAGYVFAIWK